MRSEGETGYFSSMNGEIRPIITRIASSLLLACLCWGGCGLTSKPDSCENSRCTLESFRTNNPNTIGKTLNQLDNRVIEICACRPWNSSSVKVEKGQQYLFAVVEQTEPWMDGDIESTPEDGWKSWRSNLFGLVVSFLKRSDKANWYALIGSIEKTDDDSFAVFRKGPESAETPPENGASAKSSNWLPVTMAKSGELYFYANDMNGRYFNNKGSLQLRITRTK